MGTDVSNTTDTPESVENKRPKRGAPFGHARGVRTGVRTDRHGLVMSRLSKLYPTQYAQIWTFRKRLEAEVVRIHGKISYTHTAEINMAVRYEMTARIAEHLVATGESENVMTDMNTVVKMGEKRNRCIKRLNLDKPGKPGNNSWDELDEQQTGVTVPDQTEPPIDMPIPRNTPAKDAPPKPTPPDVVFRSDCATAE